MRRKGNTALRLGAITDCVVAGGSWCNRFPQAMETGLQAAGKLPSQAFSLLEIDFSLLNVATHSPQNGLFVFAISAASKV